MTAKNTAPAEATGSQDGTAAIRRRPRVRIGIQSKLLAMLLVTSIISAAVVGVIGYQSGYNSLRASVFEGLTEVRDLKARQLRTKVNDLQSMMLVYSSGATAGDAVRDFSGGFADLRDAEVSPEQAGAVAAYYNRTFGPGEDGRDPDVDIEALMPQSPAQEYLQANYTARLQDGDAALQFDDARDGSKWSAANARYHKFFRGVIKRFGFEDVLLLDTRGNVVYSAYKRADLGTNILTGPYRGNNLRDAYREALDSTSSGHVAVSDFGDYLPAAGPTAWMVTAIGPPDQVAGVFAVQFPISGINALMTTDGNSEYVGLGSTGETVIVGDDNLMRTDSRQFIEDPAAYKRDVVAAGTPPDIPDEAIALGGTTLVQPMATEATERARRGETGTLIATDYLGHETLQAYAPIDLPGLRWNIIAKIDTAEAFAPVSRFTRTLVLSTVGIVFVVCMAALLLARLFVQPVRRLESGVQRISQGDYDVALPVTSRDEFGDLTKSFNDMSRSLRIKEDLLNDQRRENDRLLLSLMPEKVVERYRDGEDNIAQNHQDVAVIFANAEGLEELAETLNAEESLAVVNQLVRQFDGAAESLGVEKVRTLHNGYLASCGLSVPRIDNVRRVVDFAVEMQRIIDRFNAETGHRLRLRAGINTGTVTSGLVGRSNLVYDMWGAAVNLVYQVQNESPQPGIYVTGSIFERMRDSRQFVEAGQITVDDETETIWRLVDEVR